MYAQGRVRENTVCPRGLFFSIQRFIAGEKYTEGSCHCRNWVRISSFFTHRRQHARHSCWASCITISENPQGLVTHSVCKQKSLSCKSFTTVSPNWVVPTTTYKLQLHRFSLLSPSHMSVVSPKPWARTSTYNWDSTTFRLQAERVRRNSTWPTRIWQKIYRAH